MINLYEYLFFHATNTALFRKVSRIMVASLFIWLAFSSRQSILAQTLPTGFSSALVSSQWDQAVGLTFSKDGKKMFVWEKIGKVWVVENNQKKLFIDISDEVGAWRDFGLLGFALHPQFDTNGYFYLLYTVDRHHLLHYGTSTYNRATNDYYKATIGRVTRYTAAKTTNGYSVNTATRKVLLGTSRFNGIPSVDQSHGVGSLVFGSDGTLLISAGDGAGYTTIDDGNSSKTYYAQALSDGIITKNQNIGAFRSQLLESYNGKILRINPETGQGIASNPFYDGANPGSVRSKVWSLGLRNPFRMILKPGTGSSNPADANPGVLYVGDVGYLTYEEINVVNRPGMNFGWPLFEGLTPQPGYSEKKVYNYFAQNPQYGQNGCTQRYFYFQDLIKQETASGVANFSNPCNSAQGVPGTIKTFMHSRPIIDWKHGYRGPSRTGTFSGQTATVVNIGAPGSPVAGPQFGGSSAIAGVFYTHNDFPSQYKNNCFFGDYASGWMRSLAVDGNNKPLKVNNFIPSGTIVVAMAINPTQPGIYYINYPSEIRKISYNSTNSPPTAVASASKLFGTSPLTVQFTGSKSTDPEGMPLTYVWNFGDGTSSKAINPAHTFTSAVTKKFTVTLTVTDNKGATSKATLSVSVGNTPPLVTITSPVPNTLYPLTKETVYALKASVSDKEQPNSQLSYKWQTILHHEDHEHAEPFDTAPETTTTIAPVGCDGETYYFRITLTVTDGGGLTGHDEVRIYPDCNSVGLRITDFVLMNADRDSKIAVLHDGSVVNLAKLPTKNISIRAITGSVSAGSVVMDLRGPQSHTQIETGPPHSIFGDTNGNYNPWTPPLGAYSIKATPYTLANGAGTPGTPLSINFTVINQATTASSTAISSLDPEQSSRTVGLSAFPVPTPDGKFQVSLTKELQGEVTYTLVSLVGEKLTAGKITLSQPTTSIPFDLSRQMHSAGAYFLLLESKDLHVRLKLMRQK